MDRDFCAIRTAFLDFMGASSSLGAGVGWVFEGFFFFSTTFGLGAASSSLETALRFWVLGSALGSTCLGAAGLGFAGEVGGVVFFRPLGSTCLGAAGPDFA